MRTGFDLVTLPRLLANAALLYPGKAAVIDAERSRSVTYAELDKRVTKLANALRALGVRKGDKVAYMSHDRLECVEILFAVNRLGAAWVPQNYRFRSDELARQMEHCDAEVLFVDERCMETCLDAIPQLTKLRAGGLIAIGGDNRPEGFVDYEAFLANGSSEPIADDVDQDEVCGIIYTSGTTGVAKGVMHSHRSFIGWAMVAVLQNVITSEDNIMNVYPMFHMGGTVLTAIAAVAGCTMVVFGSFDPERWLEAIERYQITATFAVPTILNAVTKLPEALHGRYDLSSLKRLATSGAPFLTETQEATLKLLPGVKLYSYYSATEAFQSMLLPEDHARKVRCVGPAAYGMEVKVTGDDGQDLPPGEAGIIYARGISVCEGYYKNPEAMAEAFRDGWVTCGDVGYFDEEGFLYVTDRKKDIINSGGEKIFSPEIEGRLLELKGLADVAVVGVPDEFWGERVHVVVSLVPGASLSEDDILKWCEKNISGYKRPRSAEIWNELPKSPVGKILKREIRDGYWKDVKIKI
jgi:acyl-CoA synthetase (AMP-forming)/AMP-acid ligase II